MKGYDTSNGYMGYVEGKYILFAFYISHISVACVITFHLPVLLGFFFFFDVIILQ